MTSVLFLGGGRRVELGRIFKDAGMTVSFYELSKEVPVNDYFKVIIGKRWADPGSLVELKSLAKLHDIIIPLQDEAVLSAAILKSNGLRNVLVSNYESAIKACDKLSLESFMADEFYDYFPFVNVNDDGTIVDEPIIIKPRYGFGSRGLRVVYGPTDAALNSLSNDFVVQRYIENGTEFSVDAYFNKLGDLVDCVPRSRLRVGSGEVITSKTVHHPVLENLTQDIGEYLWLNGPINFQYIIDSYGNPYLIEINARFGGGSTLSYRSGLDYIDLINQDMFGTDSTYTPGTWKPTLLERSYRDHYFEV